MLCNSEGVVLALISRCLCCMESNKVEVVAILEAWWMFVSFFHASLLVESDSSNAKLGSFFIFVSMEISIFF